MANHYRSVLASGGGVQPTGDAVAADVLTGKTFSNANAVGISGTMPNNGAVSGTASPGQPYTIPIGYHNGSGIVTASGLLGTGEYLLMTSSTAGNKGTLVSGTNTIAMGALNSRSFLVVNVKGMSGTVSTDTVHGKINTMDSSGTITNLGGGQSYNFNNVDALIIESAVDSTTTYTAIINVS